MYAASSLFRWRGVGHRTVRINNNPDEPKERLLAVRSTGRPSTSGLTTRCSLFSSQLLANGQVLIQDANDALFGSGVTVNVNSLLVTTKNIDSRQSWRGSPLDLTSTGRV